MKTARFNGVKSALAVSLMALGLAGTASAAYTACPSPASPSLPYDISTSGSITSGANPATNAFTCGGLTFSNFVISDAGGAASAGWTGIVDLTGASSAGGVTVLTFNPNLQFPNPNTKSADLYFSFEVSGAAINRIDLGVGGSDSFVTETISDLPLGPGGVCAQANHCLTISTSSGAGIDLSNYFTPTSPIYVFKDIHVGPGDGAALSNFSQSFHVTGVPEPASLSMMGLGLLGLGLFGRRKSKV